MRISEKYRSKQLTPEFIDQATKGGLKFEMFLVPSVAEWIIKLVAEGYFCDPSDALFHMLNEYKELCEHPDLHKSVGTEIIKRSIEKSEEQFERGEGIPAEEVFARLREMDKNKIDPVIWKKDPTVYDVYCADDGWIEDENDIDGENNVEEN